jgi:putative beta-barrel porin BBP2
VTHETNIDHIEGGRPETTEEIMAGLLLVERTADLDARVLAQIDRRHFTNHTFPNDTTGYLDGIAIWTILPRRLNWIIEDVFRQVQFSLQSPDTPSNRTASNSLNTGPDFTFAFSTANAALFGGRYGRLDIKDSNQDNERVLGYVRGVHALSPQTKVSLNYEAARIRFVPGAQTFDKIVREDLFGRFETLSAGDGAIVDLGKTHVIRYGGDPLDGHIVRLALTKAISRQLTVRATYSDQISDTYSDLIRGATGTSATTGSGSPSSQEPGVALIAGDAFANGDLYHSKLGTFGLVNQGAGFEYTLQAFGRTVDFDTLDQDYDEIGGRLLLNWIYSGALRFNAYADYLKRTFFTIDRTDMDRNVGVTADYMINRNLILTISGGRLERESTAPGNSFIDQRFMLLLGYTSGRFDLRARR